MEEKELSQVIQKKYPVSEQAKEECRYRLDHIAKPLHSLGMLEELFIQLAGIYKTSQFNISNKALIVMCADNGIVEEGVSQAGMEITKLVAENLLKEETCVAIMAKQLGVRLVPVDIGIVSDSKILNYKIAYGTKNFLKEPAMTKKQAVDAILVGMNLVHKLKEDGIQMICTGEMGIGNTTTSSILAAILLDQPVEVVTGKGAGLSDAGLEHKCNVIKKAIENYELSADRPIELLATVGGLDIAGLVGVFLGGMVEEIPIVMDGFISCVAALLASKINSDVISYAIASHVSKEPAGKLVLEALGKEAIVHANLCLGEGTGAMTILPMLDMMQSIYHKMSTFHEIGMDDYKEYQS